jgi:hypothetical protein
VYFLKGLAQAAQMNVRRSVREVQRALRVSIRFRLVRVA